MAIINWVVLGKAEGSRCSDGMGLSYKVEVGSVELYPTVWGLNMRSVLIL